MKPYIIVTAKSVTELEESVGLFIVEGYHPTGGPGLLGGSFTQAVYLPEICAVFREKDSYSGEKFYTIDKPFEPAPGLPSARSA